MSFTKKELEAVKTLEKLTFREDTEEITASEMLGGKAYWKTLEQLEEKGYVKITRKGRNEEFFSIAGSGQFAHALSQLMNDKNEVERADEATKAIQEA